MATIGHVWFNGADSADLEMSASDIVNESARHSPSLISRARLEQAKVMERWLPGFLSSHLGDGRMVGELAPLFVGLTAGDDRQALAVLGSDPSTNHASTLLAPIENESRPTFHAATPNLKTFFTVSRRGA